MHSNLLWEISTYYFRGAAIPVDQRNPPGTAHQKLYRPDILVVSPHQPGHQSKKKHFWQKLLQRFSEHDTDIAQRRVARQEHVCVYETVARNLSKIIDGAGKGTGGTHGQLQRKQSLSMRCEFARGHVFWWLKTTHQPRNSPVNAGECRYAGGDGGKWPRVYRHCATGRPYDFILMDMQMPP